MKTIAAIITLVLLMTVLFCACKNVDVTPTVSPNVPVVSESPAIPSPDMSASPNATANASPSASPAA
ncbi:MAG: hypothetical protein EOM51_05420 [Clostridia bacterium]|nr:hypothetical protein [Clostridia bacterium]